LNGSYESSKRNRRALTTPRHTDSLDVSNLPERTDSMFQAEKNKKFNFYFFIFLFVVSCARLYLIHDVEFQIVNSPHDGSLYVSRAFYLVTQGNFGPYDGRIFVKDLGASIVMAFSRWIGLNYLNFLNLLHIGLAIYFALGLVRIGAGRVKSAILFMCVLFVPVTFSSTWLNVDREGLDTILHLCFFSSLTFGLKNWRENKSSPIDTCLFVISGATLVFVREEAVLLLSVIALVIFVEIFRIVRTKRNITHLIFHNRTIRACALALSLVLAFKLAFVSVFFLRYGTTAVNDFHSGSFPRFIAALRSVSGDPQRPFVSITQAGLQKVGQQIPYLKRLVEAMPRLPGPNDPIATRYGVWDEFTNSHIMFWIKDAANGVGFTPNLGEAERFFEKAAIDIETACATKALECVSQPQTLLPPVKWAWLGNIFTGISDGISNTLQLHGLAAEEQKLPLVIGADGAGWEESIRLGRMHQFIAGVSFDSLAQTDALFARFERSGIVGPALTDLQSADYWCRYYDIAAAPRDFDTKDFLTPEFYPRFAQALGLEGNIQDWSQLSDQRYSANISKFLETQDMQGCWDPVTAPVLAAVIAFLRSQGEGIVGALRSPSGAYLHYTQHGRREGRLWSTPITFNTEGARATARNILQYNPVTQKVRKFIVDTFGGLNKYLLVAGLLALALSKFQRKDNLFLEPLIFIFLYGALKILALSYIALTMGVVDGRLYLSLNYLLTVFVISFIAFMPIFEIKFWSPYFGRLVPSRLASRR
jgi:hypothetical protein